MQPSEGFQKDRYSTLSKVNQSVWCPSGRFDGWLVRCHVTAFSSIVHLPPSGSFHNCKYSTLQNINQCVYFKNEVGHRCMKADWPSRGFDSVQYLLLSKSNAMRTCCHSNTNRLQICDNLMAWLSWLAWVAWHVWLGEFGWLGVLDGLYDVKTLKY